MLCVGSVGSMVRSLVHQCMPAPVRSSQDWPPSVLTKTPEESVNELPTAPARERGDQRAILQHVNVKRMTLRARRIGQLRPCGIHAGVEGVRDINAAGGAADDRGIQAMRVGRIGGNPNHRMAEVMENLPRRAKVGGIQNIAVS